MSLIWSVWPWLLVCGGGGYTKSNVARCWTYETAALLDRTLKEDIPPHDFYYEYYSDADYKLKVKPTLSIENLNTKQYLQNVKQQAGLHGSTPLLP